MGKASSAKKVARAAGMGGGRAFGSRPPYGFYMACAALIILGVLGVYNAREYRTAQVNSQGNSQPAANMKTPWYEGYAVDVCGQILPPIKTDKNPYGITTKGDGVIYIQPTSKSVSGHNATLGKFASAVGMTLNAAEVQVPGGKLYVAGDNCGNNPGRLYVMTWASPLAPAADGVLQTKNDVNINAGFEDTCNPDCESGVLLEKDQLVTIAFLPKPANGGTPSIPKPPASVIAKLTSLTAHPVSLKPTTTTVPVTSPTSTSPGKKATGTKTKTTGTPKAAKSTAATAKVK